MTKLEFELESWPLARPFSFAGHTVSALDVAFVVIEHGGKKGQGEGVVPIVFDISPAQVREQLTHVQALLAAGMPVDELTGHMSPGPARNAVDCAIWDLRTKSSGKSIWELAALPAGPAALKVDQTIGLDTPQRMADAARHSAYSVLKIKLDANSILERIYAVRTARPDAELIVDANQSWSVADLEQNGAELAKLGVAMIEQPLARGTDRNLRGVQCPIPLFADESCHTREDLPDLLGLYQGVNIKLDKTGGLTEALALARAAKDAGLEVMIGCMAGTSLSMAPAYVIATLSRWIDLDGPLLLASDRSPAMHYRNGSLQIFSSSLWG